MQSRTSERVYVDANVLAHFLSQGGGRQWALANRLFEDIKNRKFIGVTSTFTLSEYLVAVRKILAARLQRVPTSQEMIDAERVATEFIGRIGMELRNSDFLANQTVVGDSELFAQTDSIIKTSSCRRATGRSGAPEWKGPGGADCLVAALAARMNAQYIATNDIGFRDLHAPGISAMILEDTYR